MRSEGFCPSTHPSRETVKRSGPLPFPTSGMEILPAPWTPRWPESGGCSHERDCIASHPMRVAQARHRRTAACGTIPSRIEASARERAAGRDADGVFDTFPVAGGAVGDIKRMT